jgi:glyoxylase-like metal-dependent hydrolase (beta-lactamase superfamily II)
VGRHARRIAQNLRMPTTLPPYLEPLSPGLYAIDTGFHRQRFDAAYLIVDQGRAAFVDTGTGFALPRHLAALDALGLARDVVDWVIPTHVHLDHAGGAGALMRALPNARMLVHPRGARHMIDPSALWEGATAVYGPEEMARAYGEVVPVAAERVFGTVDGMKVHVGGRELRLADTPGHARHHHCVWDARTRGWFTGDTFGLSYREFDTAQGAWILPTSTPVQFEPEVLMASIRRLLAEGPRWMYLTHFGRVGDAGDGVARLGALLLGLLEELVALGRRERHHPERHAALVRGQLPIYVKSLRAHGCTLAQEAIAALLTLDLELNAQGMAVWLDRENTP